MWWPLRRRGRGRHAAGRVVFLGPDGSTDPAAPWDRADATALQAAWEALAQHVQPESPVITAPPPPADVEVPAPLRLPTVSDADADPEPPFVDLSSAVPTLDDMSPEPSVWLAFTDGSRLAFEPDDPAAVALRAVADRLTATEDRRDSRARV